MPTRLAAVAWFVLVLTLATLYPPPACAQGAYAEVTVVRYEERGRILIQMREIFEWLGWVVEWDPRDRSITGYGDDYTMTMWINNYQAVVNGEGYALDVPPRLILGKTLVPLRFVAEVTGCQVDYLGDAVQISDADGNVLMLYLI